MSLEKRAKSREPWRTEAEKKRNDLRERTKEIYFLSVFLNINLLISRTPLNCELGILFN